MHISWSLNSRFLANKLPYLPFFMKQFMFTWYSIFVSPSWCFGICIRDFLTFIYFNLYLYLFFIRHILSLSIADLMLILTAVPFVSVVYTVESWPWGNRMCVVSEFMKDFSTGVSVFTLVAMSLDRFVAIVNPLRRFQGTGKLNLLFLLDRPHRLRTFNHTAIFGFSF